MQVLFATGNPAKVKRYQKTLEKEGIELLTIRDIAEDIKIDENGTNAVENAIIKAKSYYEITQIPTIGMDNNLFLEDLPQEEQPGTHVKRIDGKELNDEEMIDYYTGLVKKHGGKLNAKWVYGMAICNKSGTYTTSWSKGNFYMVDKPCKERNLGYPLDSISIIPRYNKYSLELTEQEKEETKKQDNIEEIVHFIVQHVK